MNAQKILIGEFIVASAFVCWGALKHSYMPWPPALCRMGAAFGVLGVVSMAAPEVAAALGGGVLLAGFLKIYQGGIANYMGGLPTTGDGKSVEPVHDYNPLKTDGSNAFGSN